MNFGFHNVENVTDCIANGKLSFHRILDKLSVIENYVLFSVAFKFVVVVRSMFFCVMYNTGCRC